MRTIFRLLTCRYCFCCCSLFMKRSKCLVFYARFGSFSLQPSQYSVSRSLLCPFIHSFFNKAISMTTKINHNFLLSLSCNRFFLDRQSSVDVIVVIATETAMTAAEKKRVLMQHRRNQKKKWKRSATLTRNNL